MQLSEAKQLKYGSAVRCQADRGDPAFVGTVRTINLDTANVCTNYRGVEFIWIEVMRHGRHKSVWPSNRIERA